MRLCVNNSLLQKYNTFPELPNNFTIFNKPIASARSHFLLGSGPKIKYQRYFSSGPDPKTKKIPKKFGSTKNISYLCNRILNIKL